MEPHPEVDAHLIRFEAQPSPIRASAAPELSVSLFRGFTCRGRNKICILNYAASIVQDVIAPLARPCSVTPPPPPFSPPRSLVRNNKNGLLALMGSPRLIVVDFLMATSWTVFLPGKFLCSLFVGRL